MRAKKLYSQSEGSHPKSNPFQAPSNWDLIYSVLEERICCDFFLFFTRFFFFSIHNSPTTFFSKAPTRLLCDSYVISVQNSMPFTLLLDCIVCFLEHGQIAYFPEVLCFRFYCVYKPIQQSVGLYHHAGLVFFLLCVFKVLQAL